MIVLFAASEAIPFAKTGGLADVAGTLPQALAARGHDVRLVIPLYQRIDSAAFGLEPVTTFTVPLGSWRENCEVLKGSLSGSVTVYFLRKDVYFKRPELYGTARGDYPDNAERFTFFARALLELCRALDLNPDVLHCHDWQTALAPFFLMRLYRDPGPLRKTGSVFTIHNLGYQGLFAAENMRYTGLGMDAFTPEGLEFWGKMNFLKGGLVSADAITTVSRTYSREIQTPEYGYGLEGVIARRAKDVYGIINGIDYRTWDPEHDQAVASRFTATDPAGKEECRQALRRLADLPRGDGPIIGMVARLAAQKGFDILTEALPAILKLGVQLVVLGTGDEIYRKLLADAEAQFPRQMRLMPRFDESAARAVYAGSDIFLMPSLYEPCGLGQMIALRYGAVPVVRKTGGLADTVVDHAAGAAAATGFHFEDYSAEALTACLGRAVTLFQDRAAWRMLMKNGMMQDFSLERMALEYEGVYRKVAAKHGA